MTNQAIDSALAKNLDKEGLLRLRAVELSVEYFRDKQPTREEVFQTSFEMIYNFLKDGKIK